MRTRFEGTMIWEAFSVGRLPVVREELNDRDLIEWTHTKLSHPSVFYFLPREDKRALLDSIKLSYLESVELLAAEIAAEVGPHYAVHVRLGDYFDSYASDGYQINRDRFRDFAARTFTDHDLPIMIATDGLQEKDTFESLFEGRKLIFIDELVFDDYLDRYRKLEFTDFNVLTILNQLLCASAELFIGTYRSTFTSIIHRLRQERHGKTDFNFFPDEKVAKQLNAEGNIAPDRSGFFDWNRYSIFADGHSSMSWMREWNHELSAIDT